MKIDNEILDFLPAKINCPSLEKFWQMHFNKKKYLPEHGGFSNREEDILMGIFELGKFETYKFLYTECENFSQFKEWILNMKGEKFVREAALSYNLWQSNPISDNTNESEIEQVLSAEQINFWEKNGYIKLENIISAESCEAVIRFINTQLGILSDDKSTWYNSHEKLQGMMFQDYQDKSLEAIRFDKTIRKVFSCLYNTNNLIVNCEKVSYNPPEKPGYTFKGSPLHWDIDFKKGPSFYIQGLVYLNDVPENRGPLEVIPGFQHHIDNYLSGFTSPHEAIESLRKSGETTSVTGKQGDLILWHQALPHAATANRCEEPRYVQYISFSKL